MRRSWFLSLSSLSTLITSPLLLLQSTKHGHWRAQIPSWLVLFAVTTYLLAPVSAVDHSVRHHAVQRQDFPEIVAGPVVVSDGNQNNPAIFQRQEQVSGGIKRNVDINDDGGKQVKVNQHQFGWRDVENERGTLNDDMKQVDILQAQEVERRRADIMDEKVKQEQKRLVEVQQEGNRNLEVEHEHLQQNQPVKISKTKPVNVVHNMLGMWAQGHHDQKPDVNFNKPDTISNNDNNNQHRDINNIINNNISRSNNSLVNDAVVVDFKQEPTARSLNIPAWKGDSNQDLVNQFNKFESGNNPQVANKETDLKLPIAPSIYSNDVFEKQKRETNNGNFLNRNINPFLSNTGQPNEGNNKDKQNSVWLKDDLNKVNEDTHSGNNNANPQYISNNNNQKIGNEFSNQQPPQQQPQQPPQQPPQQQQQYQQYPHPQQQQQQQEIGGINISWDWDDFSIMFNSYGAAEMKVRRTPHGTTGEPWPLPQYYSKRNDKIFKISKDLALIPVGVKCDILEEALARHLQRILRGSVEDMYDNLQNAEGSPVEDPILRYLKDEFVKAPLITKVEVKVRKPCSKYPTLRSDESYDLVVKKRKTYIWANEIWGALRALETLGHLVWKGSDDKLYIKETVISDYPRFPHRGLLVDTSRHFFFKEVILDILDAMEMNKLNVFHWHIVDDQSFPYESKVYPELSSKGAFHPTYVYSLEDIAEIIEYARLRGIRVMPEFDTPGHTFAWGFSRPELLTQCYTGNIPVKGYFGPIDPSKNSTYRFLQTLFQEIVEVFKDEYLHLGGDEVPLGCWQSNPEVMKFAQELAKLPREPKNVSRFGENNGGWSSWSDEIRRVYEYYENRLINIISEIDKKKKKGIKYVMWQEVMNNNLQLPNDTIIQVWMGEMADVSRATNMGYNVLYSTCWYMDHIEYGTKWTKYYTCDPVDQNMGFVIDEKKVLGGEAAFWSEYFTNENLIPLMWPRASAAAERLWSSKDVKQLDKAAGRLTEHRCRMIKRGINAGEINGPGYCLHQPAKRRVLNETLGCREGNCSHTRSLLKENFEVFVSERGAGLAECTSVFNPGSGKVFIILVLVLIMVVALYTLTKSSNRFHRLRICKNRSVVMVFILVLVVYILCYTTIWMRAFEFSGSFHKTVQEDNTSDTDGNDEKAIADVKTVNS